MKHTFKKTAQYIFDAFYEEYEDEIYTEDYVEKMSEKKAKEFVLDHIDNIIATNGESYLWDSEVGIIKEHKLWKRYGWSDDEFNDLLKYHGFNKMRKEKK
jgi:hypothetical protein